MNAVLMQATGPVASMTGSPTPAPGDFLAVLADALAPSPADHSGVVALAVVPDAQTAPSTPSGAAAIPSMPTAMASIAAAVPMPETARSVAIAYGATDAATEPAEIVPSHSSVAFVPLAPPLEFVAESALLPDEPMDPPVDDHLDDAGAMVAAAPVAADAAGRLTVSADSVVAVHDDSTPTETRSDLESRQPVGVAIARPTLDVATPPPLPWNGHGPVDVAADVRPVLGHVSSSRPGAHAAHGSMVRPGWLDGAIGAQALALCGDAAVQAVGQYVSAARPPASSIVRPVTEQPGAAGAAVASVVPPAPTASNVADPALPVLASTPSPVSGADPGPLAGVDGVVVDDADRPAAVTRHGEHATAVGDTSLLDRTPSTAGVHPPAPDVMPTGAAQVRPAPAGPVAIAAQRTPHPGGLGMIGTDRVDRVRQQTAGRPVQRLTVDLDDARVAVRVRGAHVAVDVLSDPSSALGQTWARDVERTLETAMRAQDSTAARLPIERDRTTTGHAAGQDHANDRHHGSGADGRGDQSGREQRRAVPWWLTEEDE